MFLSIVEKHHGPTFLFLMSDFTFVMMDAMAQRLQKRTMTTAQVVLLRFLISGLFGALWVQRATPELYADLFAFRKRTIRLIWIKWAVLTINISAFYLSLRYLPISDVLTLFHLKPFPTAILCMVVLKEIISKVQVAAMVISICAVVLVTQPTAIFGSIAHHHQASATELLIGYTAITVAALGSSLDLILLKVIGTFDSFFITLVFCIDACVLSAIYVVLIDPPLPIADWATLLALCIFGFITQITNLVAVQHVTGIRASLMGYFQIPFAAIVQVLFTFSAPSLLSVVGSMIIIGAGTWSLRGSAPSEGAKEGAGGYEPVALDDVVV